MFPERLQNQLPFLILKSILMKGNEDIPLFMIKKYNNDYNKNIC